MPAVPREMFLGQPRSMVDQNLAACYQYRGRSTGYTSRHGTGVIRSGSNMPVAGLSSTAATITLSETLHFAFSDTAYRKGASAAGSACPALAKERLTQMVSWERTEGSFFGSDRPLTSPLFGTSIPALVYTDGREILPDQMTALSSFLDIPADQRGRLIDPLFEDFRTVTEVVGEGPKIITAEQVWQFVTWTTILVPLQGPGGNRFVFVKGDPAWEQEHGVELLFRDERLVRLNRASGAFLSTCFWEWA